MNLKQIFYFVTIVNEGQITRAAHKLHMAQPPLSYQLKKLEQELGVLLIERTVKRLNLTKEGEILYKKGVALLKQVENIKKEIEETGKGVQGDLAIGCVKSYFDKLSSKIMLFHKSHPNVTFQLRSGATSDLVKSLQKGNIELAIVKLPFEMDNFEILPLPDEPYIAVIPENWNSDNSKESISLEELAKLPLLLLHRGGGIGQFRTIINHFKHYGYEPKIVCECPDVAILLNLVVLGMGASIVPKSTLLTSSLTGLKKLNIEGKPLISESVVIWKKNRYLSKSAENFIKTQIPHL